MEVRDKVCVITGAAGGIGAALAQRFASEAAKGIVVADKLTNPVHRIAEQINGLPFVGDMTSEDDILTLIERTEEYFGEIDIFCSNAGTIYLGSEQAPNEEWQYCWNLHLMAHVFAARHLAPRMATRGDGYILNTASAAGLLSHVESATYTVTKHAAVAFAEWISISYGSKGVKVSVLCPQAVRTPMLENQEHGAAAIDGVISAEFLAECVIESMRKEEFLILPHQNVRNYMRRKSDNPDRWLRGMRKYKSMLEKAFEN